MFDADRRQHPRSIALVRATLTDGAARQDVVATNVGPGGAFFTCRTPPQPGSEIELSVRGVGHNAPNLLLCAEVVHAVGPGQVRPAGFGVRWIRASSRTRVEPLQRFLTTLLRVQDLAPLQADDQGGATYEFAPMATADRTRGAADEGRRPTGSPPTPAREGRPVAPPALGPAEPPRPVPVALAEPPPAASGFALDAMGLPVVPKARPPTRRRRPDSHAFAAGPDAPTATPDAATDAERPARAAVADESWPPGVPRALAERYSGLRLLGQGGNGVVFRAEDRLADHVVVLKFMAPGGRVHETARKYFLREFKLTATLQHPNIVRIFDIGSVDGVLYYAMEYLDGLALSDYVRDGRPLRDPAFLCSVVTQLCAALDHAHENGVLHRDVKPSNVLVLADGTVKLFDFGLARVHEQGTVEQSLIVGTPWYMAPEQARRGPVDHRADIYSLGVILYRLVTGQLPFTKGNVLIAHATEAPLDPRLFEPDLPVGVTELLRRMLAKRPEQRPGRCAEVARELVAAVLGPGGG